MRLIDANALKWKICDRYPHFSQRLAIGPVFEEIEKAPSVDAVIVTRCKDCKHRPVRPEGAYYYEDIVFPDEECPCSCADPYYSWIPEDDWFCPKGERKED